MWSWDQSDSLNPYSPRNLTCEDPAGIGTADLYFADGTNPYYPYGLCMLSSINLSGLTPFECEASGDLSDCRLPRNYGRYGVRG